MILALAGGQDGAVWVGTRNGFSRLRNGAMDSYGYRDGLSQNTVFGVYEDREGALWVATKNGLNQFLDGAAARYDRSEGLPNDNMGPVFQDRRGTLWAGSLDGVLSRFNGTFFTPLTGFSARTHQRAGRRFRRRPVGRNQPGRYPFAGRAGEGYLHHRARAALRI